MASRPAATRRRLWIPGRLGTLLAAGLLALSGHESPLHPVQQPAADIRPQPRPTLRPSTMKTPSGLILTNQFLGPIETVLAGADINAHDGPDGLNPLQRNFFKALHQQNLGAHVILVHNHRLTATGRTALEKTLYTDAGFPRTQVTLVQVPGNLGDYQQDNLLALVNPKTGEKIALEPKGGYGDSRQVATALAKQKIGFTRVMEADVYFEGGDVRPLEGPNGPSIIIGYRSLWEHTMRYNHAPTDMAIRMVQSTSAFIRAFEKYGYNPKNLFILGSNSNNQTYGDVFQRMKPADLGKLHPQVLAMRDQPVPWEGMDYHSDLVVVRTGQTDRSGKPLVIMSEPVPPPAPYLTGDNLYISDYRQSLAQFKNARRQVEGWGFAVRTVPYAKRYPEPTNPEGVTLINYTNVVMEETPVGKTRIYIAVRGGNDLHDQKALETYREVYGDRAVLVPVVGMRQQRNLDGLLNCLFNVTARKERPPGPAWRH